MDHPVWKFESDLTNRLLVWSILSILSGLYLWFATNEFGQGFGIQAAAWGVVDAAIAVVGARSAARRSSTADPKKEALFIRKVLWINVGLDILYVIGGLAISAWNGLFWM